MIYLSQLMGNPVLDSEGEKIGSVSDLGIATGECFSSHLLPLLLWALGRYAIDDFLAQVR